jgi:hypothetical protein
VTANAERKADLLWGLRGGGGNFGVVTSLEIAPHPVASVYGGSALSDLERARAPAPAHDPDAGFSHGNAIAPAAEERVELAG